MLRVLADEGLLPNYPGFQNTSRPWHLAKIPYSSL